MRRIEVIYEVLGSSYLPILPQSYLKNVESMGLSYNSDERMARISTEMGFNGSVMDVRLTKVKAAAVFEDHKEKMNYLVRNHLINKAGGELYKTGTIFLIAVWYWWGS